MPCMCWYTPSDEHQRRFKEACQNVANVIKEAQKIGDPENMDVEDAAVLIKHLIYDCCDEKPRGL